MAGRGTPPPGHDQVSWMVVGHDGARQNDEDLTWPEAWRLKEKLAGSRKVKSPRIEQVTESAAPTSAPEPVSTDPTVNHRMPRPPAPAALRAAPGVIDHDDLPEEVAAASRADEDIDAMLAEMDAEER